MYATDQFVGMLDDNTADLTDPDRLRQEWGIWHETGHTQQQYSWTFAALDEVNVNLHSLNVQERFGEPSQLAVAEDGDPTILDRARDYLDQGAPGCRGRPSLRPWRSHCATIVPLKRGCRRRIRLRQSLRT